MWEQAFSGRAAFDAYRADGEVTSRADEGAWTQWSGGRVRRVAEVFYERRTADPMVTSTAGSSAGSEAEVRSSTL